MKTKIDLAEFNEPITNTSVPMRIIHGTNYRVWTKIAAGDGHIFPSGDPNYVNHTNVRPIHFATSTYSIAEQLKSNVAVQR